jgi:gamma-glutamyl-gamma-aminobutyraldehyde dehydrogenase
VGDAHADRVMDFTRGGKRTARLVGGGERRTVLGSNAFVTPMILDEVAPDDSLAQDEVFGPVLAAQSFEAAEMVNNTVYGLAASVWPRDLSRRRSRPRSRSIPWMRSRSARLSAG